MTDPACERWIELSDRVALGEPLAAEEALYLRTHPTQCPACAAEATVWESLGRCLDGDTAPPRSFDPPRPQPEPDGRRRWLRWGGGAAVAAAAAAAVALVLGSMSGRSKAPAAEVTGPESSVSLVLVAGEVDVRGAQAALGAVLGPSDRIRIAQGRACLAFAPGISVCADDGTELRLLAPEAGQARLALEAGRILCRLDAQPPGTRFAVETRFGRVTAKGTVFAVEYLDSEQVAVRVHRGLVDVSHATGAQRELRAHAGVALAAGLGPLPMPEDGWTEDAHLTELSRLWNDGAVAPLHLATEPPDARVELDGLDVGRSPVSTLVGRGEHEAIAILPAHHPVRERFAVLGAEQVTRTLELAPIESFPSPAPDATPTADSAASPPSAAELLGRARALRSAGRYGEAATAYQQLLHLHRGSAEARAALVSLGELQLSQLGRPGEALRSFDRYLTAPGSLTQEARYGRVRALRRLGRTAEAQSATDSFLRDYPGSAQAESLRSRPPQR